MINEPGLKIRKAKDDDKEEVLNFTKNTWENGDYIHLVWDDWINDKNGELLVAETKGKPVAILHLRYMPDNSVWLEGLRVNPLYRRKGIAFKLNKEAIRKCIKMGYKVFRGAIFEGNEASINLSKKLGFKILENMWEVQIGKNSSQTKCKELNLGEFLEYLDMILQSYALKSRNGMIFHAWAWMRLSHESIKTLLGRDKNIKFVFCDESTISLLRLSGSPRMRVEINVFPLSEDVPALPDHEFIKNIYGIDRDVDVNFMLPKTTVEEKIRLSVVDESYRLHIFEGHF